ncbi:PIN domain-like protein [Flagelloscypha sp. PMI_526]|nr:PIN domain-like protein [Flagelloscypha sp. PMI_526]
MGVQNLWTLLTPVGRPVLLETMEGKRMAIDSSIWIYQFTATMRDKQGQALANAPLLGFLRRIAKLLFYGIKPVFVFDGGAPELKRETLRNRRKRKEGAKLSHAKLAERLLAAKLRREALKQTTSKSSSSKEKSAQQPKRVVYMDEVDPELARITVKRTPQPKKKPRWSDHDPYALPDVDLASAVSKRTENTAAPDPRLATEEELRTFIAEMKPEDFDISSEAFRELPTDVQYEIVGDLRLKSRQTSYTRLQNMLRTSKTPLDFSKQQIANLKQRNHLTQQLLTTTDVIGRAHISIPVRLASERNREYVLVKNDGPNGGWVLGIHDNSGLSMENPIEVDRVEPSERLDDEDEDDDMEEVEIPDSNSSAPTMDADLREYSQSMALSAIARRQSPKKRRKSDNQAASSMRPNVILQNEDTVEDEDSDLAMAIQASLDDNSAYFIEDTRLATTLSIAGAGPSKTHFFQSGTRNDFPTVSPRRHSSSSFVNAEAGPSRLPATPVTPKTTPPRNQTEPSVRFEFGAPSFSAPLSQPLFLDEDGDESEDLEMKDIGEPTSAAMDIQDDNPAEEEDDDDDDMEEVVITSHYPEAVSPLVPPVPLPHHQIPTSPSLPPPVPPQLQPWEDDSDDELYVRTPPRTEVQSESIVDHPHSPEQVSAEEDRLPSPVHNPLDPDDVEAGLQPDPDLDLPKEDWEEQVDHEAEEGEFAKFLSQVKGKDLGEVQKEIDQEIQELNQQQKAALRESEMDVNGTVVAQIMSMLRLFGIPYITAPMEAEAQCAELLSLNLVDGIITDDSDVFLFGATRVYKNMFNQSKTVECFLSVDLTRELGLDRDTLVRLAYLLGSDYTEGLSGVGPVLAMEVLKEFNGEDGLLGFARWWRMVQSGKDEEKDMVSAFRKRFKKRFKTLYLHADWPNTAVQDAYYHPVVDSSDEPFKWGLPDLDGLRTYLASELNWGQSKVDELLLPIISKMGKRNKASALAKQGNLNEFFDISAGSGTLAPRQRQAYSSKRLQQVISDYRKTKNGGKKRGLSSSPQDDTGENGEEPTRKQPPAKRRKAAAIPKDSTSKGRKGKKKGAANDEEDESTELESVSPTPRDVGSDDEQSAEYRATKNTIPDNPLRATLRPRPKPRPVIRPPVNALEGMDGEGDRAEAE